MYPNPQKIAYLVTFTEEIFNGKHFLQKFLQEFCKIFKNIFFAEHLRWLLLEFMRKLT